jgi:hypothetical protein
MDNQPDPHVANADANPALTNKAERVLQPSASSVADIQAAQTAANQAAANGATPPQTNPTPQPMNQPRAPMSPASIYPEATKGIGIPPLPVNQEPVTPSTEQSPVDLQIKRKILLVRLVAGVMLFINAVNAYDWFLERRGGYTNWVGIIEIIIMLALAAYIFKLSEVARATYVFIATLLIVLTCVSTILFYVLNHGKTFSEVVQGGQSLTKSELKEGIVNAEHDPRLTPTQKQQSIKILQNELNAESGSTVDIKAKEYFSDALLLITTVGPIIFFTRPSIKAVFE